MRRGGNWSRFNGRRREVPFGFDERLDVYAPGGSILRRTAARICGTCFHARGIRTNVDHHKPIFATLRRVIGLELGLMWMYTVGSSPGWPSAGWCEFLAIPAE